MNREVLKNLFDMDFFSIRRNTEGISHEESLVRPGSGGNSINWCLGHILVSRHMVLDVLEQPLVLSEGDSAPYERGSQPLADSDYLPLDRLQEALQQSQERIGEGLETVADERLASQNRTRNLASIRQEISARNAFSLLRRNPPDQA